ncbi:MAG: hypothetical protein OZX49_01443 [Immundisolibacter sp.]|nr:hypothetical protein [Immundisolibacter sp.]
MPPAAGAGFSDRLRNHHPARRAGGHVPHRQRQRAGAGALRAGRGRHHHHHAAVPGVRRARAGADRRPDAGQEAALAGGPARRVRPREPDPPGAGAAQQAHRCRGPDGAPVRHHGAGKKLPREPELHWPGWPAGRARPARAAAGMAAISHRHRAPAPAAPPHARAGPPAHPGRPADRVPEHRRGDRHHPLRGPAQGGADGALRAQRRAGRGDSGTEAAPPGPAGRNAPDRRARRAGRRARFAAGDAGLGQPAARPDPR